jgi:hypothetical protein
LATSTDVCLLTLEEAGRLEHYGVWPTCRSGMHRHVTRREAEELVAADVCRYVGGADTKIQYASAIVRCSAVRVWEPVQANREDGVKLQGFRTWGLKPTK